MVNNPKHRRLVSGSCTTKATNDGRTKVTNGPVYDLKEAQELLKAHGLRVVTESAGQDMSDFQPELTDKELTNFILALDNDDYIDSERCKTSANQTVDCDSYTMKWNRHRHCRWEYGKKIYVKFGFGLQNPLCLVVSIHLAKW